MAASALDAPVIMFFKNSLWPGASMITYCRSRRAKRNLRRIDGDVLLLLLEQSIEKKSILEFHPLRRAGLLDLSIFPSGNESVSCRIRPINVDFP